MDRQKVFNKVARHLLRQNAQSKTPRQGCRYRAAGGLKCAAGCLIPDELYSRSMEGRTVHSELVRPILLKVFGGKMKEAEWTFLRSLQIIHDCNSPSVWKERLKMFAKARRLKISHIVALRGAA